MRRHSWWVAVVLIVVGAGAGAQSAAAASPWTVVPSPNRGTGSNELAAVAATSATNAWAVGPGAQLMHWNGTAWSLTTLPVFLRPVELSSISAVSASDVWAAGSALIHYNGTTWEAGPIAPLGLTLTGVSATSSTNVWVIATSGTPNLNQTVWLLRWNGTDWERHSVITPCSDCHVDFTSVKALSSTNVWGTYIFWGPSAFGAHSIHWNGSTIEETGGPVLSGGLAERHRAVGASSASNVWEVGGSEALFSNDPGGGTAARFDGALWSTHLPPSQSTTAGHAFNGVAVVSPTLVWAGGSRSEGGPEKVYLARWDGVSWTEYGGPNPASGPSGTNRINGMARVPGTTQFWAVGFSATSTTHHTMILRCC
jgi:hypothetical protein